MNCKPMLKNLLPLLTAIVLCHLGSRAFATPYASGITNNAGTVSFFLNEPADNVQVVFNSGTGSTNNLGALTNGLYSFALGANTNFSIQVTKASGPGFKSDNGSGGAMKLQISSSTNRYLNFESPRGLKVNRNPASPYFGRIYTSNSRTTATGLGRPMQTGVYMINPDQTSAHQAGQEDTALTANLPSVAGGAMGASFPYELAIGQDDSLYLCDWTDTTGNLWVTDPDVTGSSGAAVLKPLSAIGTAKVPVGVDNTHGSINAAHVEGSLAAGNLTVWTIDEDLQSDKTTTTPTELSSLWRFNVGSGPLPYLPDPTKLWTATGKQGVAFAAQTGDMVRSTNGNFYIVDARSVGDESGLSIVDAAGTPVWNSWDASQLIRAGKDILTNSWKVAVSYDDKYVAVARQTGIIWVIPMVNGIPDLSQRLILTPFSSGSAIRGLAFDAAGNLYVNSNSSELVGIFSPGGTTVAVTLNDYSGTNGGFFLTAPATTVSVVATTPTITESGGTNGVFTITRTGNTGIPLPVSYLISGTASNGVDYTTGSGAFTFAAFQTSTNIAVVPILDSEAELTETVVLVLQGGAGYSVGLPGSATLSILDDETPQISFSTTVTNQLLESYAPAKVSLQLTRRGLLTPPVTINLAYSGAAMLGADFNGPSSVSLAAGAASTNITLTPINDQLYEGNELIVASVASGTYNVGTANAAYVLLVDDEYPAGTILFSDDFNGINSSNLWALNLADPTTDFVEFNWNYGAYGIPVAPGTTDGSTLGMRMRCGNVALQLDGLSVSPTNGNFTGDYRLKFDMWINYNGPMPDGGPGSTQNFDAGVGTTGDQAVWFNGPFADGLWFTATGDGADGDADGDYTAFLAGSELKDDTGFYAAGTGAGPNTGIRNASHPFYSLWGGQAAPAAQLSLFPNQTGVANSGNAGMAWHTVVITKAADTVKWQIDGVTICTVTNDPGTLSTNIFVGYQDKFASGSLSDVPEMSFGIVDNLKVERYVSAAVRITNIAIVGGNVEITFSGPAEKVATDFKLQGTVSVTGAFLDDNTATLSNLGAGLFKATTALGGPNHFYKIKL